MFLGFSFKKHIFPFVISFLSTIFILAAASVIFSFFPPSPFILEIFSGYSYLLSGFIAAFFAARARNKSGLLTGIIAADIYISALLLLGTLISEATFFIPSLTKIFALSSLCGAIGGVIGINCK